MSATGSAGVLTFERPWVVNQAARASRIRSCSAPSVFPTIQSTSQRLHHKAIREGAEGSASSTAVAMKLAGALKVREKVSHLWSRFLAGDAAPSGSRADRL